MIIHIIKLKIYKENLYNKYNVKSYFKQITFYKKEHINSYSISISFNDEQLVIYYDYVEDTIITISPKYDETINELNEYLEKQILESKNYELYEYLKLING